MILREPLTTGLGKWGWEPRTTPRYFPIIFDWRVAAAVVSARRSLAWTPAEVIRQQS